MMMERKDKVEPLLNMLKKESIQLEDAKNAKATVDTDKRQLLDKLRQERVAVHKIKRPWTLVTECYDDYNTILRELQTPDGHAEIKASILNVENGQCHAVHRPYPAAKLTMYREQYGMLGFLDKVSCDT
ncbi:hypothetical protein PsorP6_009865 [Peronosclerospora sorghi]|uniref:Uncharacterized protein n=1 Tax=Peronosclerospora sorghi TaxID=230839 RepID=A0ACC0W2F8_9STRA|nr:hypothetical protein PsorP6_009865 [Peronosclerospora sorghi]